MKVVHDQPGSTADAQLSARDDRGHLHAQAGLWWREVPTFGTETVGCLGAFETSSADAARALLEAALQHLRERGCTLAIGPMDGNTWRRHRFVIEDSGEPPFFLEPQNPPEYPAYFTAAGFRPLATYSSSALPLAGAAPDLTRAMQRLGQRGITIRDLDAAHFRRELDAIYDVCLASFSENFLYTPISREEFVGSYAKVEPLVDPALVRIAELHGEVIGFLFALPDEGKRVVLKTLAVDPHHRFGGLGSVLVAQVQERARAQGSVEAIHALQHDSNSSRRITARHHARIIRRYALYSCKL